MGLLVRVEHFHGRPIEPETLTEDALEDPHIYYMQLKSLVNMKFF